MKTIGLIGGITWPSTQEYYRLLNQLVNERMGGVASAKIILISLEFGEIKRLTEAYDWNGLKKILCEAAKKIENAGADCLLVCANTMHNLADAIQAAISIPLIHVAEETGKSILKSKIRKVALLGTKYTMQLPFYKESLAKQGIETIIPDQQDIEYINNAIYTEMGKGIFLPERKKEFICNS